MIKRLLAQDGVLVVCQFRDDGAFVEGYGLMEDDQMHAFVSFAHDYKRIVQGNADQLSMFTRLSGWTPPEGWIVHSGTRCVCSIANFVCLIDPAEASVKSVMEELKQLAHW